MFSNIFTTVASPCPTAQYQPPCDLEEIETEIKTLEKEIVEMLRDVTEEN